MAWRRISESLTLFRNPSLVKQVVMAGACAFASLCLFGYGSDKFEGSSVCLPLVELSVCFQNSSALIKSYKIMSINQRQARGHGTAFPSPAFSLRRVKSHVVLPTQQIPSSCQDLLKRIKNSFRFIWVFFLFFMYPG